jgi:hypothetical protein
LLSRRLSCRCTVGRAPGWPVLWPALRPDLEERLQGSAVVLFTRDLRVRDNPALAAAVERFERVLPLFVLDGGLLSSFGAPNRVAFVLGSSRALRGSLRARGGELALRRGDVVEETVRAVRDVKAERVFLSEDVSGYAQELERRLRRGLTGERVELDTFPGVTVVPPGELAPAGFEAFRVFTPYWRRWRVESRRPVLPAPERIVLPGGVAAERAGYGRDPAGITCTVELKSMDMRTSSPMYSSTSNTLAKSASRIPVHSKCMSN